MIERGYRSRDPLSSESLGPVGLKQGSIALALVYRVRADLKGEGEPWGLLIDIFGNDWFREQHRIVNQVGEGWIYYSFTNPATGRDEPKASYLKSIDWDGALATIGAGVYRRDLPGTCRSEEVNAMGLRRWRYLWAMLIGYARGPTEDQDTPAQTATLKEAGYERGFSETAFGGRGDRPQLHLLLNQLRSGNVVVV